MKKFFYLLASAALLLGACTKDEDPSLKVSPESLAFDGSASSKNVTIESNTAWEITGIKDWVSINKTSGNGNETIIVTVLENDGLDRECTVNISSSAAPATIKISQTGRPNLNVSEKDLEFGSEAARKRSLSRPTRTGRFRTTVTGSPSPLQAARPPIQSRP